MTEQQVDDSDRGLYRKYMVERLGGTPGKHRECFYYVLDLDHDPHAIPALRAYMESCQDEYPELAADIKELIEGRDHLGPTQPA